MRVDNDGSGGLMPENDLPETPADYDEYFRDRVDRLNQAIE